MSLEFEIQPVTGFAQNCSIVWCTDSKAGALIDPGGEADSLLGRCDSLGIRLEQILVTHGHLDHAGAVKGIADQTKLPVIGPHRDDAFWLDALDQQAQMFGLPSSGAFVPDRWLTDGDQVSIGQVTLDVIVCPGHTPGHVVFISKSDKLAFVGDVLFSGGVGRSDFPRGSHDDLIHSITAKLLPLGDDIRFVPGHGPMSTFGTERLTNPYLR